MIQHVGVVRRERHVRQRWLDRWRLIRWRGMLTSPSVGGQQCHASHNCENHARKSDVLQIGDALLPDPLTIVLWCRIFAPNQKRMNVIATTGADGREDEIRREQFGQE